ncbi:PIN domain-containing protein [Pararhizobium sp. O133]|uniref:PIN domain-containing protein n=1 Tax=Pararhizobium sp. O133 TaxID=3449278 RepID=UPI003F68687D
MAEREEWRKIGGERLDDHRVLRTPLNKDAHRTNSYRPTRQVFGGIRATSLRIAKLAVSTHHFNQAAKLANDYASGLRAGDALHMALSLENKATLCTLDKRLAAAGLQFGITTLLL